MAAPGTLTQSGSNRLSSVHGLKKLEPLCAQQYEAHKKALQSQ